MFRILRLECEANDTLMVIMIQPDVLFIFGAKSTALEIAEVAEMTNRSLRIIHVVGDTQPADGDRIIRISAMADMVAQVAGNRFGIISMANHALRLDREQRMRQAGIEPITLIHPDATVAPSAQVGPGCYLAAGARVSSHAVMGPHCMINLNATIGHDVTLGAHCVINPGAAVSGHARLGSRVLLGANAFVLQLVAIGDDCKVDAMTYVSRDIPPAQTVSSRTKLMVLPTPAVD